MTKSTKSLPIQKIKITSNTFLSVNFLVRNLDEHYIQLWEKSPASKKSLKINEIFKYGILLTLTINYYCYNSKNFK